MLVVPYTGAQWRDLSLDCHRGRSAGALIHTRRSRRRVSWRLPAVRPDPLRPHRRRGCKRYRGFALATIRRIDSETERASLLARTVIVSNEEIAGRLRNRSNL